jgi:hypothetical protein
VKLHPIRCCSPVVLGLRQGQRQRGCCVRAKATRCRCAVQRHSPRLIDLCHCT